MQKTANDFYIENAGVLPQTNGRVLTPAERHTARVHDLVTVKVNNIATGVTQTLTVKIHSVYFAANSQVIVDRYIGDSFGILNIEIVPEQVIEILKPEYCFRIPIE